jgi:predicted phosphate transport protein (TIGR00153 family)
LSELLKWFEKRRENKAITTMQRHLATIMSAVEDLEKALKASINNNEKETKASIDRVISAEKEADRLRRVVMTELSGGELPPTDREDLMHLIKRIDMVADWSRESTRILGATPMKDVPDSLKMSAVEMIEGVRECATALRKCINSMAEKPEEALKAADEVERLEEKVDDLFENARRLLAKEEKFKVGAAILMNELLDAIEMAADMCEDACDQVRIIIIRR